MDEPYKTPETDPGIRSTPSQDGKWSNRKVCFITFFPMFLCLCCGFLVLLGLELTDIFGLFVLLVVVSALICAIATAIQYNQSRSFHIVGQLLLWMIVHTALICIGFFGCIVVLETGGARLY